MLSANQHDEIFACILLRYLQGPLIKIFRIDALMAASVYLLSTTEKNTSSTYITCVLYIYPSTCNPRVIEIETGSLRHQHEIFFLVLTMYYFLVKPVQSCFIDLLHFEILFCSR